MCRRLLPWWDPWLLPKGSGTGMDSFFWTNESSSQVDEHRSWASDHFKDWTGQHSIQLMISPGQAHERLAIIERRHQVIRRHNDQNNRRCEAGSSTDHCHTGQLDSGPRQDHGFEWTGTTTFHLLPQDEPDDGLDPELREILDGPNFPITTTTTAPSLVPEPAIPPSNQDATPSLPLYDPLPQGDQLHRNLTFHLTTSPLKRKLHQLAPVFRPQPDENFKAKRARIDQQETLSYKPPTDQATSNTTYAPQRRHDLAHPTHTTLHLTATNLWMMLLSFTTSRLTWTVRILNSSWMAFRGWLCGDEWHHRWMADQRQLPDP